jgi:hypothetical protein
MAFVVKQNELFDPVAIPLFGAIAIVASAHLFTHLFEVQHG